MNSVSSLTEQVARTDKRFTTGDFGDNYLKKTQCVTFCVDGACYLLGLEKPIGFFNGRTVKGYPDAKNFYNDWKYEKGSTPKDGAILVYDGTHGSGHGHVAIVSNAKTGEIVEGNYDGKFFNRRIINLKDSTILGYCYLPNYDVKSGWVKENNKWYYYENGTMVKNKWVQYKDKWYYLLASGVMATSQWVDSNKYYVDSSGVWVENIDLEAAKGKDLLVINNTLYKKA